MGEVLEVLCDSVDTARGIARGRWRGQALEVDGEVILGPGSGLRREEGSVPSRIRPGAFLPVRVRGAGPYDLVGCVEEECFL